MATKKWKCNVCGYIHEGESAPAACPICKVSTDHFEAIDEGKAPSKKLDTNSNVYTVVYASVMVVLVAIMLAFTSQSLRDTQKKNEEIDKQMQILRSIGVASTAADAQAKYAELVKSSFIVNAEGKKVDGDAATISVAAELKLPVAERRLPVFVATVDGQTKYILALSGSGLWGPIWGYLALNDDKRTIFGADFSHQGETPGLGAEISKASFSDQFKGLSLFVGDQFTSVDVVKPGKAIEGRACVDGISGGTITSEAVDVMLLHVVGDDYLKFLCSTQPENAQ